MLRVIQAGCRVCRCKSLQCKVKMNKFIKYGKYIAAIVAVAIVAAGMATWQYYVSPEGLPETAEADSLVAHARDALLYNRYQAACDDLAAAKVIYEYCGDKEGAVQCDLLLTVVYFGIGQIETCQSQLQAVRENLNELPVKDWHAYHRLEAFLAVELSNEYDYAEKHMREAIAIVHSVGNESVLNSDMGNLAEVYIRSGDYAKAEAVLDSIDFRIAGTYQPQYYYCKGMMAFRQCDYDTAYAILREAVRCCYESGVHDVHVASMEMMLYVDSLRGDDKAYIAHYKEMVAQRDKMRGAQVTYEIVRDVEEYQVEIIKMEEKNRRLSMAMGIVVLSVAVLLLAAVGGIMYLLYRRQAQLKRISDLELQQKEAEVERHRLERELLDLRHRKDSEEIQQSRQDNLAMSLHLARYDKEAAESVDHSLLLMDSHFCHSIEVLYPQITKTEKRLACFIKMQMNSDEIIKAMNISAAGFYKLRYRLRKRMGLTKEQDLEKVIQQID